MGDKFYVVLQGRVSVLKRNPVIRDWAVRWHQYSGLLSWKEKDYDLRAKKSKDDYMEDYMLEQRGAVSM